MNVSSWMDTATHLAPLILAAIALVSACVGLQTYRQNGKTQSAKFLMELHEAFFVKDTYRDMRELLDAGPLEARLEVVEQEGSEFTDFLNFFELVAYLRETRVLSRGQVEALLGYYLQILADTKELRAYIRDKSKGFEYLDALLHEQERRPRR